MCIRDRPSLRGLWPQHKSMDYNSCQCIRIIQEVYGVESQQTPCHIMIFFRRLFLRSYVRRGTDQFLLLNLLRFKGVIREQSLELPSHPAKNHVYPEALLLVHLRLLLLPVRRLPMERRRPLPRTTAASTAKGLTFCCAIYQNKIHEQGKLKVVNVVCFVAGLLEGSCQQVCCIVVGVKSVCVVGATNFIILRRQSTTTWGRHCRKKSIRKVRIQQRKGRRSNGLACLIVLGSSLMFNLLVHVEFGLFYDILPFVCTGSSCTMATMDL